MAFEKIIALSFLGNELQTHSVDLCSWLVTQAEVGEQRILEEEQIHRRWKMETSVDVQGHLCPNAAVDLAYMLKLT